MNGLNAGWRAQRRRQTWLRAGLMGLALVAFLLPLAWTLVASLGIAPDATTSPPAFHGQFSLVNYTQEIGVAEPGFWLKVLTTATLATLSTLATVLVAFLAAYSLARSRIQANSIFISGFLILASLPVMAYIIPLADIVQRLHLYDTFAGLTLVEAAVAAPLAVFVLFGYLRQVPTDLEEAAHLEGAGLFQILGRIVLPLVAPGVIATALVIFVLNWNSLLIPLVLASVQVKTVSVALVDFFTFERELEWQTAAAALIISLLPILVLVGLAHRALDKFVLDPTRVEN